MLAPRHPPYEFPLARLWPLLWCLCAPGTLAAPHPEPALKPVGPGLFTLGKVRLDQTHRSLTFPAVLNMKEAMIEYLLVTSSGKTHESLLRTDVAPRDIHVAMLLLNAKSAGTNAWPQDPAPPPGDPVAIELSWQAGGQTNRRPAEALVFNRQTRSPMAKGHWIYTGSRISEGQFVAQRDGSIVSLITDPDALINNGAPGRDNDEIWEIISKELPALNTPFEVTIRLQPPTP